MKIRPEERRTVMGLSAAIAVFLCIGVYNLASRLHSQDNAASPSNPAANGTGATSKVPSVALNAPVPADMSAPGFTSGGIPGNSTLAASSPDTKSLAVTQQNLYSDDIKEPSVTRDPFKPVISSVQVEPTPFGGTSVQSRPPAAPVATMRANGLPPGMRYTQPAANFRMHAMKPPAVSQAPVQTTGLNPPPAEITLAGVIAGTDSVAVLHVGDRAYQLVPGEKLPYNLSLSRVTEEGVFVKQGQKMWFIEVGKTLSAARPVNPGAFDPRLPAGMPPVGSLPLRRLALIHGGVTVLPTTFAAISPETDTSALLTVQPLPAP